MFFGFISPFVYPWSFPHPLVFTFYFFFFRVGGRGTLVNRYLFCFWLQVMCGVTHVSLVSCLCSTRFGHATQLTSMGHIMLGTLDSVRELEHHLSGLQHRHTIKVSVTVSIATIGCSCWLSSVWSRVNLLSIHTSFRITLYVIYTLLPTGICFVTCPGHNSFVCWEVLLLLTAWCTHLLRILQ